MAGLMDDAELGHLVKSVVSDLGGLCSLKSLRTKCGRVSVYSLGVLVRESVLGVPFVRKKEIGYVGFSPVFVKNSGDPHSKYAGIFVRSISFLSEPEVKEVCSGLENALGEKLTYVSSIGEVQYANGQLAIFNSKEGCVSLR